MVGPCCETRLPLTRADALPRKKEVLKTAGAAAEVKAPYGQRQKQKAPYVSLNLNLNLKRASQHQADGTLRYQGCLPDSLLPIQPTTAQACMGSSCHIAMSRRPGSVASSHPIHVIAAWV